MNSTFIVNFIGKASPATIKQLAAVTHENDGKWLISKVNFIEDQVAGVLKVQLPAINESIVKEAFSANPDSHRAVCRFRSYAQCSRHNPSPKTRF